MSDTTGGGGEAAKKPKKAETELDLDTKSVTTLFSNGQSITVALDEVRGVLTQLALFGLQRKLANFFADEQDPDECYAKAFEGANRLKAGEWSKERVSGAPSATLIILAISKMSGKSTDETQTIWAALPEDRQKVLRADEGVKAAVAAIKAERAAARAAAKPAAEGPSVLADFGVAAAA